MRPGVVCPHPLQKRAMAQNRTQLSSIMCSLVMGYTQLTLQSPGPSGLRAVILVVGTNAASTSGRSSFSCPSTNQARPRLASEIRGHQARLGRDGHRLLFLLCVSNMLSKSSSGFPHPPDSVSQRWPCLTHVGALGLLCLCPPTRITLAQPRLKPVYPVAQIPGLTVCLFSLLLSPLIPNPKFH